MLMLEDATGSNPAIRGLSWNLKHGKYIVWVKKTRWKSTIERIAEPNAQIKLQSVYRAITESNVPSLWPRIWDIPGKVLIEKCRYYNQMFTTKMCHRYTRTAPISFASVNQSAPLHTPAEYEQTSEYEQIHVSPNDYLPPFVYPMNIRDILGREWSFAEGRIFSTCLWRPFGHPNNIRCAFRTPNIPQDEYEYDYEGYTSGRLPASVWIPKAYMGGCMRSCGDHWYQPTCRY